MLCMTLFVVYYINEQDILCPSFLFVFSFLFSVFWACLYADKWDLGLHLNTFLVISYGIVVFVTVSCGLHFLFKKIYKRHGVFQNRAFIDMKIPIWVEIIYLCFVAFICLWMIKEIITWADVPFSRFIEAGRKIDKLKFQAVDKFGFSSKLALLRVVVTAGTYWFGYMLMNEVVNEHHIDIFKILIIGLSIWSMTLTGSRSPAMYVLIALTFFLLHLIQKKKDNNVFLSKKMVFILLITSVLILASFRSIGLLMQRNISQNTMDYLALYIGAEIKNLDLFLQEPRPTSAIWGSQTFFYLVRSIGKRLGIANSYYALDLPFRYYNGYNLGNVYTVFYPFIYDFGYIGVVFLTGLMAAVCQVSYEIARNSKNRSLSLLFTIIYGTITSTLLLAFFSNKFYENIFTVEFVKRVIILVSFDIIFNMFFSKKKRKAFEILKI